MEESIMQNGSVTMLIFLTICAFILGYLISYFVGSANRRKLVLEIENKFNKQLSDVQEQHKELQLKTSRLENELTKTWMDSKDDLKKIEGIGTVIEDMLNSAGIYKWKQLKREDIGRLKNIIYKGGDNFKIHDPATWPKQADLADSGKWDELKDWQKLLKGGKVT